jgi:hypothetical protein
MQIPVNHVKDCSDIPIGIMPEKLFQRIMATNNFYRLALELSMELRHNPYKSERIVHGNNKTRRKKQKDQTAR